MNPLFNRVLSPSMETSRTDFCGVGELGKFRIPKFLKAPFKLHRKIEKKLWKHTVPKPIRRVFSRKNFVKYAPILAAVAQVLNVIPGLGIAVGAAIMAGLAVVTAIAKVHQEKADYIKQQKTEDAQANAAFQQSQPYITETYGITFDQFKAMKPDDKVAFLQQVQQEAQPSQTSGWGMAGVTRIRRRPSLGIDTSPQQDPAALQQDAMGKLDEAWDTSQGYFSEKYNLTDAQFKGMTFEGKLNFMQVAVEDADKASKTGELQAEFSGAPAPAAATPSGVATKGAPPSASKSGSGWGKLALAGIGLFFLFRKSR